MLRGVEQLVVEDRSCMFVCVKVCLCCGSATKEDLLRNCAALTFVALGCCREGGLVTLERSGLPNCMPLVVVKDSEERFSNLLKCTTGGTMRAGDNNLIQGAQQWRRPALLSRVKERCGTIGRRNNEKAMYKKEGQPLCRESDALSTLRGDQRNFTGDCTSLLRREDVFTTRHVGVSRDVRLCSGRADVWILVDWGETASKTTTKHRTAHNVPTAAA